RVRKPSKSGKLVYPIANLFFVQWEDLKSEYPRAVYAGRLL
ncbi:MAG: polysaccharide biosynthesis protein, partial [Candidatus Aenigmatarchaeota archaeon]